MRSKPPEINKPNNTPEKKGEFIDSANAQEIRSKSRLKEDSKKNNHLPWNSSTVRKDITKTFNLRLSEPDYLKLKFIAEHNPESMQGFCLNAIIPEIEKEIKKITIHK
jgi:hypothetical protein